MLDLVLQGFLVDLLQLRTILAHHRQSIAQPPDRRVATTRQSQHVTILCRLHIYTITTHDNSAVNSNYHSCMENTVSIKGALQHNVTHTSLTALCPGLPGWAVTRKVKPIWILLKQETVSGSCISWAMCKSAPRSRQITIAVSHHSVFYRPDALPAAQPTASKHWRQIQHNVKKTLNDDTLHTSKLWNVSIKTSSAVWNRLLLLHPFNGLFFRTTWVSQYQKGKTSLDLNETRDDGVVGCSGISWTICKQSAPRS